MGYRPEPDSGAFTYASHACKVAVDIDTGKVKILDYAIVEDCGTIVNPMIVEGQTYGGATQGIGTALLEESITASTTWRARPRSPNTGSREWARAARSRRLQPSAMPSTMR